MTFSRLIEVLQEMTRTLPESAELPLTMALKNQVSWYPHYPKGTTDGQAAMMQFLMYPHSLASPCSTPC